MWAITVTLLAVLVAALVIFAAASSMTKKRKHMAHEKLDENYIYRKEPHADQVAEKPNKLEGNEVTKG